MYRYVTKLFLALSVILTFLLSPEQMSRATETAWANNTSSLWQEVDLRYTQYFSFHPSFHKSLPAGCTMVSASGHGKPIGHRTEKAVTSVGIRCQAQINLLRPVSVVNRWQQQQKQQGFILFSLPEMGIDHIQAHIKEVKPSSFNLKKLNKQADSAPVIGVFIRYTTDVRTYTFKDTMTGEISQIHATPNHPFYLVNRHQYLPISSVTADDTMISTVGHKVTLICPAGHAYRCGKPWYRHQVILVYNLEVYRQHRYFVGPSGIMVHNVYTERTTLWRKEGDQVWRVYEGSVNTENSQRHGYGIEYDASGRKTYEGDWENDEKHGWGIEYLCDGSKFYEGNWRNGFPHREGINYRDDYKVYEGEPQDVPSQGLGTRYTDNPKNPGVPVCSGVLRNFEIKQGIKYDERGIATEFVGFDGRQPFKLPPVNIVNWLFHRSINP